MREDKHLTDVTLACMVNRCPTERVSAVVVPKDFSSDLDELEAKVLSICLYDGNKWDTATQQQ